MANNKIILIGMPGSGKSTLGYRLARRLSYPFIDMDDAVEAYAGRSIPELFAEEGEAYFRQQEAAVAEQIKNSLDPAVVATGGGAVTLPETMAHLQEAGQIYFIDRPLEAIQGKIDRGSRPLLANQDSDRLTQLYKERIDLYHHYSDFRIVNDSHLDACLDTLEQTILDAEGE